MTAPEHGVSCGAGGYTGVSGEGENLSVSMGRAGWVAVFLHLQPAPTERLGYRLLRVALVAALVVLAAARAWGGAAAALARSTREQVLSAPLRGPRAALDSIMTASPI
jgi:hypothetical protein